MKLFRKTAIVAELVPDSLPVETVAADGTPESVGFPVPVDAVLDSTRGVEDAGAPTGLQVWRLKLSGSRAAEAGRFYGHMLDRDGWRITGTQEFPNGYGQRFSARNAETGAAVRVNIAKWPHEDYTAISVYYQGK